MKNTNENSNNLNMVFKRVEKKYLLNEEQNRKFREKIAAYMKRDEYGLHTICNIYYDTKSNELVSRSIEKPLYKEKLRFRTYGIPTEDSMSFVEIKKKYKGIVYKRREALPYKEGVDFLDNGIMPDKDSQILHEIKYFMDFYKPQAKLFLAYDREAFYGIDDPLIRMTIDQNIRYREDHLKLHYGDGGTHLFKNDMYLLEIKVADSMPIWLTNILNELSIYSISFSKYGSIYKKINNENLIKSEYGRVI